MMRRKWNRKINTKGKENRKMIRERGGGDNNKQSKPNLKKYECNKTNYVWFR